MNPPQPNAAFHWRREPWGLALLCTELEPAAQHLFTSRQLALPDDDSWRLVTASLGSTPDRLMRVKQVHGHSVRVLTRGDVPWNARELRPDADALASNQPGLVLAVMVADCVPILIADPVRGAAAAVHAGWRGTCAQVAPAAIAVMQRQFGTNPSDLIAAIGPSVGPDDYEVGESVVEAFAKAGHSQHHLDGWFRRGTATGAPTRTVRRGVVAKPHLDLWRANADQLAAAGLRRDRIFSCGLSTVTHTSVFESYRVDGERAGRMAGLIVVPPPAAFAEASAPKA
jgi:YfiH family protein